MLDKHFQNHAQITPDWWQCTPEELYFLPKFSEGLVSIPLHSQTLWLPSADEEGYGLGMVLVLLVLKAIQSNFSCE